MSKLWTYDGAIKEHRRRKLRFGSWLMLLIFLVDLIFRKDFSWFFLGAFVVGMFFSRK